MRPRRTHPSDGGREREESHQNWIKVWLPTPKTKAAHGNGAGYVLALAVRSPMNYRAQFRKERGAWKLASFLAGD